MMKRFFLTLLLILPALLWIKPYSLHAQENVTPMPPQRMMVNVDQLNIYIRPDLASPVVGWLPKNLRVTLIAGTVAADGLQWWYILDWGYGWIPGTVAELPTLLDDTPALVEESMGNLTVAIENNTADASIYAARSLLYINQKEYELAVDDLTEAISRSPNTAWFYHWRGRAALEAGDFETPMNDFNTVLTLEPNHVMAYLDRADIHRLFANLADAGRDDFAAEALVPDYALTQNQLAIDYDSSGDPDAALNYYTEAIKLDPQYVYAYVNRANIYFRQGNLEAGLADLNLAIQVNPYHPYALRELGHYYENVGDYVTALNYLNQAVEADPQNAISHIHRAIHYYYREDYFSASQDLAEATFLDPYDEDAFYWQGRVQSFMSRYEEAEQSLMTALWVGGYNTIYVDLASIYAAMSDYVSALGAIDDYLLGNTREDFVLVAYVTRASIYVRMDDYVAASQDLAAAFALDPEHALSYATWERNYRITPAADERGDVYFSNITFDPTDAESRLQLGHVYLETGLWVDALVQYQEYMELSPSRPIGFDEFVQTLNDLVIQ